ncbi:unnamed protein product [Ambrosiozyma monospora]|uniref:Unnamed protein product n=1 Tax=Ambrosiozyma monospora TaxID=43982 RepID=A0ACB5TBE0_AMBMO|nr:unnamed protein product [Ambrosiozyma monospora]
MTEKIESLNHPPQLGQYLSSLGLEDDDAYSYIILKASGKEYYLHKVIVSRSPFFEGLLNWHTDLKSQEESNESDDQENKEDDSKTQIHSETPLNSYISETYHIISF